MSGWKTYHPDRPARGVKTKRYDAKTLERAESITIPPYLYYLVYSYPHTVIFSIRYIIKQIIRHMMYVQNMHR